MWDSSSQFLWKPGYFRAPTPAQRARQSPLQVNPAHPHPWPGLSLSLCFWAAFPASRVSMATLVSWLLICLSFLVSSTLVPTASDFSFCFILIISRATVCIISRLLWYDKFLLCTAPLRGKMLASKFITQKRILPFFPLFALIFLCPAGPRLLFMMHDIMLTLFLSLLPSLSFRHAKHLALLKCKRSNYSWLRWAVQTN